jgi:hypothetical protein
VELVLACLLLVGRVVLGCCLFHQLELLLTFDIFLQSNALLCIQGVVFFLFKLIQFIGRRWLYALLLGGLLRNSNLTLRLHETLHVLLHKWSSYNIDYSGPFLFIFLKQKGNQVLKTLAVNVRDFILLVLHDFEH